MPSIGRDIDKIHQWHPHWRHGTTTQRTLATLQRRQEPMKKQTGSEGSETRRQDAEDRMMHAATHQYSQVGDMEPEKTIAEIEMLEHILTLLDNRPLRMSDWKVANQHHDEKYASDPWFRLWKRDGKGERA